MTELALPSVSIFVELGREKLKIGAGVSWEYRGLIGIGGGSGDAQGAWFDTL